MSNFEDIRLKLEEFIKRYYFNELLKGVILFFAIGLLYLIATLFIEYTLWLNPTARTYLFWLIIVVEIALFIKFIAFPLAHLFNLRKGIDYESASKLIGSHFPEVNDKLLNVLQLKLSTTKSDLLLASIEQKSKELKPIPFKTAINLKSNTKYLKYAAIPIAILLVSFLTGKINWFSDSYERVVNYQTAYEPPAPFQFYILNDSLKTVESKDYTLKVSTVGSVIPENAQINFNNESYFLQQVAPGEFQYVFNLPKKAIDFRLSANNVTSKTYSLEVVNTPNLLSFEMVLDYPRYINKKDEILKSTGSAVIPEGTNVTWIAKTKSTTNVKIYSEDTLHLISNDKGYFKTSKRIYKNFNYIITTSNHRLKDYENLAYRLDVVKDNYPELTIKVLKDSIDQQSLYFYGQASDDYGLTRLNMIYYPVADPTAIVNVPMSVSRSNFSEFVSAFPNQLTLEEGVSYQLYFEVYDNDAIHKYKRTKSSVFSYRKLTKEEEERQQLNEQNETINDISKTLDKLQEQDKKLEELSKTQKEKVRLNFNDKKKFEDFLKRQKNQEQLMKNFNKKLQENLEEFQKENNEKDQFKEDLKERLKENEEQLKQNEKLLEELEQLKEKIDKEEFTQKLEELAKQNKNKKRSMQQLLELTKRFYIMKKAEKVASELDKLGEEQLKLTVKKEKNTKEAQEQLNKKFEDILKDLNELKKEDRQLRKPMDIPTDKPLEDSIKFDQKEATKALESQEKQENSQQIQQAKEAKEKAEQNQKKAAKKLKEMSEMMMKMMSGGGGGGDQMSEDIEMLRQILENLLLFSFDQEKLMQTFNSISINHNSYGKYIINQSYLREHFEHIDDSLFALSLRQPKLSEKVNSQITEVYFNIDKALGLLTENRIYQGVASQQYTITASNELASFLSDVLDNMEMSMNPSPGSGPGDMQLPDIIKSQEELNEEMKEGIEKGKEGEEGKDGKEGKKGEDGKEGEGDQDGKQGKNGENGKSGNKGQQNGNSDAGQAEGSKNTQKGNGKNGNDGKDGQDGGKKVGKKNDGYGEGGSEEQNAELFRIYQRQQMLRQALEEKLVKSGKIESAGQLIKQMEQVELDLLNYGFTNQTLQKMMELQHQLLKLENATFLQGQDSKRKSKTNNKDFIETNTSKLPTAKQYFNTTEILNRQALPLRSHFKKKIQEYFKSANDQF